MPTNNDIIDKLVHLWDAMSQPDSAEQAIQEMSALYDPDMVFQDPIQTLRGRDAFLDMSRRLVQRSSHLSMKVEARAASGEHLFLKFHFEMKPRLGPLLRIDGVTHLRVHEGRIVEHRDHWDLLSGLTGSVPLLAPLYRAAVARLG